VLRVLQNLTYGPVTILGNLLVMRERARDFRLVQRPSKNHRENESGFTDNNCTKPKQAEGEPHPRALGNGEILQLWCIHNNGIR